MRISGLPVWDSDSIQHFVDWSGIQVEECQKLPCKHDHFKLIMHDSPRGGQEGRQDKSCVTKSFVGCFRLVFGSALIPSWAPGFTHLYLGSKKLAASLSLLLLSLAWAYLVCPPNHDLSSSPGSLSCIKNGSE